MSIANSDMVSGGRTGSGRRARLLLAAALLASLTIPISSVSTAAGACDPHQPKAIWKCNNKRARRERCRLVPLSVKNLGPCNADGVVLTDNLPAGVSLDTFRANPSSIAVFHSPVGAGNGYPLRVDCQHRRAGQRLA